jgi:hypothetical protein
MLGANMTLKNEVQTFSGMENVFEQRPRHDRDRSMFGNTMKPFVVKQETPLCETVPPAQNKEGP